MSNGPIKHFILISILMLVSTVFSQENPIPNGYQKTNAYTLPNFTRTIQNLNEINLSSKTLTGDWKVLKNWNEGRAVVAESDSIVWVGTPVGLVRWNVALRTYKTFDANNGLNFTAINSLAIDQSGKLWIATGQGLAVYANQVFTHYDHTNSPLLEASIDGVCIDNQDRTIITYGPSYSNGNYQYGGVCRIDGNDWKFWSYGVTSYWGPIVAICLHQETIWIGGGGKLFILTNDGLENAPDWVYGGVYSIAVDNEDSLWVESSMRKTLKRSGNGWDVIIDRDLEGMGGEFDRIWNDPSGGMWLSQSNIWWSGYGPYRLDIEMRRQGIYCGTSFKGICNVSGIPGQFYAHYALNPTAQFFVSIGSGTTWPQYQTSQGGLYKFNGLHWEIFRVPTTILENEIYGLGNGKEGNIYLSTPFYSQKTNGTEWETIGEWVTGIRSWNRDFRFGPNGTLFTNHHQNYPNPDSYSGYVTGLDFDGFGNLWSAYPLIKFKWPNLSQTNYTNIINEITNPYRPQFMDVIVDKNEHVWGAAWYYGGVMYDGTNWHPYPPSDTTLPNGEYDLIFADTKGNIWFGTNQSSPNFGFTIYNGKDWNTYYSPQRYAISYVYQITEDHFGNVWLATGGGLLKYDGYSFTLIDSDNSPLSFNYTSAVTVDDRGNIWVGTDNGLYVYNPNTLVEFGLYSFNSPVNDFNVVPDGKYVKTTFQPNPPSSIPVKYQLQRGRGTHKFWTIAEAEYSSSVPTVIEIKDSSLVIGQYYYRINEVTADGKQRFSQEIQFSGGTPGVSLLRFENYVLGNQQFFKWETRDESFVQRYELWRKDSLAGQFSVIKFIQPEQTTNEIKHYEIQGDILGHTAGSKKYSLRVVYSDSSRAELKIIDVGPEQSTLPTTFMVSQNYPNPFNSATNFNISMPDKGLVTLKFYDILGEEVRTVEQFMNEGYYSINIDFSSLTSGVYFYTINSFGQNFSGKLVLLK
jgi:ligand-binding sensor domain-containing protein